jgi:hypothetical protein
LRSGQWTGIETETSERSEKEDGIVKLQHVAGVLVVFALCSAAGATITGASAWDDGTGSIAASSTWSKFPPSLIVDANQYWNTGKVFGSVTTDTDTDPNIWSRNDVYNDTSFAWTDYHIQISMTKPFSILYTTTPLEEWDASIGTPPTHYADGNYVAVINYVKSSEEGSPVAIGSDGEFDYQISFTGPITFQQVLTPSPEPATLALLGAGAMSLVLRRRKQK